MAKNTLHDLQMLQSLPLEVKVAKTKLRIKEWIDRYGEDGVYISFSGGKDSTVLLHIARQMYPNLKAVFVNTGLEYPEIVQFVKTFDNVDWLRPKMNFKEVVEKYGFPFISKEVSECVDGARKYIKILTDRQTDRQIPWAYRKLTGIGEYSKKSKNTLEVQDKSRYSCERYKFFLNAPFKISAKCCYVMKKKPAHSYDRKTGRKPITAQMASESRLRTQQWIRNGCNGFEMKSPISNPMSFWTEQDVLLYIKLNDIEIASVYGDVVEYYAGQGQFDNERSLLKTTGCSRTGCMFCGFGCHLEKSPNRFERMKETHPKQYDYIMRPTEQGGLNYKKVIDWINQNGNMNIKY